MSHKRSGYRRGGTHRHAKKNVQVFLAKVRQQIRESYGHSQMQLGRELNPLVRGWAKAPWRTSRSSALVPLESGNSEISPCGKVELRWKGCQKGFCKDKNLLERVRIPQPLPNRDVFELPPIRHPNFNSELPPSHSVLTALLGLVAIDLAFINA